jgi:nucleoside-diphosphate-sugar epimerase
VKVFVAGASGVVGRHLIPQLVDAGHEVVAMTRSPDKTARLRALGAQPVVADALDQPAMTAAVRQARPQAVVHQLTAIPVRTGVGKFDRIFAATNRLRTEGTDILLAAARAAGAHRFVAQSFCGWTYVRTGGPVKTEDDPLDPTPVRSFHQSLDAVRYLEHAVLDARGLDGLVLRYGFFYGPGTAIAPDGQIGELVAKRRFPIVGQGTGVWSFVHMTDVASATVAALKRGPAGIYNIVDDDPAPLAQWLPALAQALGAKPPRQVPAWLVRPVNEGVVVMTNDIRGASNTKAKHQLGWQPAYPSWRYGFQKGLTA